MPPHSLTLTLVGAGLLWVGWFGFNAGSNLEANGYAGLAMINTFLATAAAGLSWIAWSSAFTRGKAVDAGPGLRHGRRPRGRHPGRRLRRPDRRRSSSACVVSPICVFFCSTVKNALKYDDSLDVFGIHCIGGIIGAIGTGILVNPALGRRGRSSTTPPASRTATSPPATPPPTSLATQVIAQIKGVLVTIVWSASLRHHLLPDQVHHRPARLAEDEEEGLDISEHGERAYHRKRSVSLGLQDGRGRLRLPRLFFWGWGTFQDDQGPPSRQARTHQPGASASAASRASAAASPAQSAKQVAPEPDSRANSTWSARAARSGSRRSAETRARRRRLQVVAGPPRKRDHRRRVLERLGHGRPVGFRRAARRHRRDRRRRSGKGRAG